MTTQAEDLGKLLGKAIIDAADKHGTAVVAASIHIHTGLSQIAEALGYRNPAGRRQDAPGTPRMPGARETPAEPLRGAQGDTQRHRKPLAETDWPDTAPPDLTEPEQDRPEWATATVVQDNEHDLWGRHFGEYTLLGDIAGAGITVLKAEELEEELGPLTAILEADGNPATPEPRLAEWSDVLATAANPVAVRDLIDRAEAAEHRVKQLQAEPEWLDAGKLRELPQYTIVLPRDRTLPRGKFADGRWWVAGHDQGFDADTIAPARVLWTPEETR